MIGITAVFDGVPEDQAREKIKSKKVVSKPSVKATFT
jgi:hypothetical protein